MTEEISFADLMAFSIHDMKNFVNVHLSELEIIALQARACGDFDTFNLDSSVDRLLSSLNRYEH